MNLWAVLAVLLGTLAAATLASGRPRQQSVPTAPAAPDNSTADASAEITRLISDYAAVINREPVDLELASRVWSHSSDVSFIFPLGEEHGWEQVKSNFYEKIMEGLFSERTLTPADIQIHPYGDSAWAEFSWRFIAKSRKDGSRVETRGRETQVYRKVAPHRWVLVHVHYSAMPSASQ